MESFRCLLGRWQLLALVFAPGRLSWTVGIGLPLLVILPLWIGQPSGLPSATHPWLMAALLLWSTLWSLWDHGQTLRRGHRSGAWVWLWLSAVPRWQWFLLVLAQQGLRLACQWAVLFPLGLATQLLPPTCSMIHMGMGLALLVLTLDGWLLAMVCLLSQDRLYRAWTLCAVVVLWLWLACFLPFVAMQGSFQALRYSLMVPCGVCWYALAVGTGALSQGHDATWLTLVPTWPTFLPMVLGFAGAMYGWLAQGRPAAMAGNGGQGDGDLGYTS